MEPDCQAAVRALQDKESIRDCIFRYCRGVDRADEEALRSAYWPDAHDCHGAWRGSASGFIAQALARLRAGGRGVHQISNVLIELHGEDGAAVESCFLALQAGASKPQQQTLLCGRYLDRFEKRQGEWRIAERTVVYDWIEERVRPELAGNDASLFGQRQPNGRRGVDDPLYPFLEAARAHQRTGGT